MVVTTTAPTTDLILATNSKTNISSGLSLEIVYKAQEVQQKMAEQSLEYQDL